MTSSLPNKRSYSWFEHDEENRQTLEDFNQSLSIYISSFLEVSLLVEKAQKPFQEESILPLQCRKAISALTTLCEHLKMCIHCLKNTETLPLVLLALRYRLLDEFYYLEEQTHKLIGLINRYCQTNINSPGYDIKFNQTVNLLFATVLHSARDIPHMAIFVVDEARFQERKVQLVLAQGL